MSLAPLQEAIIAAFLIGAAVMDIRKREVSDALCVFTALAALLCFQPDELLGLIPAVLLFIIALVCGAVDLPRLGGQYSSAPYIPSLNAHFLRNICRSAESKRKNGREISAVRPFYAARISMHNYVNLKGRTS